MIKLGLFLGLFLFSSNVFAQQKLKSTVREVTAEYAAIGLWSPDFAPTPTPAALPGASPAPTISPTDLDATNETENGNLGQIIALGEKIWDFIVTNKPTAEYPVFKTSVVPVEVKSWTQLQQWSKPVSKVYRVEFTNMFGGSAGGFDYRITYFHSGVYKGKGKFIGQISVVPTNVHLKTDRSLKMNVELASIINAGTEKNPVAAAQIMISWSSPTTTRYEMNSAEYMIYGTGEMLDLSNGN